jgi:hypothetical protein
MIDGRRKACLDAYEGPYEFWHSEQVYLWSHMQTKSD